MIIDEDMRCVLMETLAYFQERGANYYHKMRHEGYLRHLFGAQGGKNRRDFSGSCDKFGCTFLQKDATEPATEVQAGALEALESELYRDGASAYRKFPMMENLQAYYIHVTIAQRM